MCLAAVLVEARELGYLGPGPIEVHLDHSRGFADAIEAAAGVGSCSEELMDLGSGGGLPGLALGVLWPGARVVLLDASRRRTEFLRSAVEALGLEDRATVLRARAEDVGRDAQWRERAGVVVARSFGSPAVTAECGSALVRPGGLLVVSEPPSQE
ncbi:MAG: RsmG family class I SAM-dependent methyltransferase, partial [Acidimicrobiales bacterium]